MDRNKSYNEIEKEIGSKPLDIHDIDISIKIYNREGWVAIEFSSPVSKMKITKKQARELAKKLIEAGLK